MIPEGFRLRASGPVDGSSSALAGSRSRIERPPLSDTMSTPCHSNGCGALHGDGVPLADLAARFGTPLYATAPATIAARYREVDQAFARLSAHAALRAEGQLDAGHRPAAAHASAPPPTPIRSARSRSRCAPASRRRRSSSPASARPTRSSTRAIEPRPAQHQRRVGRGDRAHRRDRRGARRQAPASPCASTPTSTPAATRTSRPAARATSSASPSTTPARCACACAAGRGVADRRTAQPRRLANHRSSSRSGAPREALVDPGRRARAAPASPIEHLDIGGGLGIAYEGQRVPTAAEYAASVLPIVARERASTLILEPGRFLVGTGRHAHHPGRRHQAAGRAASCS